MCHNKILNVNSKSEVIYSVLNNINITIHDYWVYSECNVNEDKNDLHQNFKMRLFKRGFITKMSRFWQAERKLEKKSVEKGET